SFKNIKVIKNKINSIDNFESNNCKLVDLSSYVLLPGLIDSHTHMFLLDKKNTVEPISIFQFSANKNEDQRYQQALKNAKSMLYAGFTTIRDLGNSGYFKDEELSKFLSQNPRFGPEIIYSGPGLAISPTQLGYISKNNEYRLIKSFENIDQAIKENIKHQATWLKVYADNSPVTGEMSEQLLKYAVKMAKLNHLKVAIHATTKESQWLSLNAAPNSIEHFTELPVQSEHPNASKIFFVLTDTDLRTCHKINTHTKKELVWPCNQQSSLALERNKWINTNKGIMIFGSDSFVDFVNHSRSRGESAINSLISFQENGIRPYKALQSATSLAAQMLERPLLGKITSSAYANLIAVDGDPLTNLEDLKNIKFIMNNGIIVCGESTSCSKGDLQ
ncbi:MAG: amidohydrolase family protein, partial [Bdellovibrionales bacterium]|nr:amidohydrolase family protein [Bdellovibrionales bacterium]